jgi:tetratricopeptide (TPR) repeat protein
MSLRKPFSLGVILLTLWTQPAQSANDKGLINLLRLPAAKIEAASLPSGEWAAFKPLTDNDPATVAQIKAEGGPVDVVYGFGGATVAPERLVVRLPRQIPADAVTGRVELLVSTLSAQAGFVSVRSDPLKLTADAQEFSFPTTGARWIMLRFTPAEKSKSVAIAEVEVLGRDGPPVSHYAFKEAPAKALDVLARLKKASALNVTISADEAVLFADVKDGKFSKWSFDEAALLASGIADAAKRKEYLKRLDAFEAGAKKAVAGAKTPFEKGDKLLAWLHGKEGPLVKGYVARQTDLSVIVDSNTFNCVSSATLYNVLGKRLGLDVRAIEVPDHAFSILYDGSKHADVETTTASGFNPERDRASQEKFQQQTGFRYIPDSHRDQRREISEAGLVAIIYYNHGVTLTEEKRHHEALLAYFRAMSLDREFDSAVKNALASLANWSGELSGQGKFEEALNVLTTGVELAPKDATLLHNRKVVWGEWAEASAKAGKDDVALAILRRAAKEVPDGNFAVMQAWIYIRRGEEFVKAGEWEKALAAVEPGFQKIDKGPQEELRQWQAGVPLRWGNALLAKQDYEKAAAVLQGARARAPKDSRLTNNLVYTIQEWVSATWTKDGDAKAKTLVVEQLKRFPDLKELKDVAAGHAHRVVRSFQDAGKYEEALAAVERHQEFLKDKAEAQALSVSVFDAWAAKFTKAKQWGEGVAVYEKGLQRLSGNDTLKTNLVYTMQEWTRDTYKSAGAEKARAVLLGLRKRFPTVKEIDGLAKAHVQRVVADLRDAGKYKEGLAAVEDNKDLLAGKDDAKALAYSVYDRWAQSFQQKKEWQSALDIYGKALESYPKDGHLTNNAVAMWNAWGSTFIDAKDWPAAIKLYEKALKQFPDNGTLQNNLEYCKEQMKKK